MHRSKSFQVMHCWRRQRSVQAHIQSTNFHASALRRQPPKPYQPKPRHVSHNLPHPAVPRKGPETPPKDPQLRQTDGPIFTGAISIGYRPPRPRWKHSTSRAVCGLQKLPIRSTCLYQQHASLWTLNFAATNDARSRWQARWAESLVLRLSTYVLSMCVTTIWVSWFFGIERVPITGRRQLSLLQRSQIEVDKAEHSRMKSAIQQYDGKFFTRDEYPGVRTIEAV